MKNKFHLETYREHEIWYNADTDKFTVELLVEDNWREKSRKSLNDCRKAIDDHIKQNLEFKPIKCLWKRYDYKGEILSEVTIKAVRHDGGFILNQNGQDFTEINIPNNQLSGKSIHFFKWNAEYLDFLDEKKKLEEKHKKELQELMSKVPKCEPLDIFFINSYKKQ